MEQNIAIGSRVRHLRYGKGIVNDDKITAWEIYFEKSGKLEVSKRSEELEFSEQLFDAPKSTLSLKEIEKVLKFVLEQYNALEAMVPLGERWKGGTLIVQPANSELQSKEIPVEVFFHKITMLRDRLRVLEQNINSHKVLDDAEKVELQQYITRIYGSLTTFNFLFAEKNDYFVGQKS